jgi:hypothetical protein
MTSLSEGDRFYVCPMHAGARQRGPGTCPQYGVALLPEGTRFGMLRDMLSSPLHLSVMVAAMLGIMAAAMTLMR